jgi:hypothetical protein
MVPENKQNRRYEQINFIALQNNHHPSQHTVGNVHKASGNKGLFRNRSQNRCHTFLDCRHVCNTCAFHYAFQAGKQEEVRRTPAGARSGEYGGLLSVSPPEETHHVYHLQ